MRKMPRRPPSTPRPGARLGFRQFDIVDRTTFLRAVSTTFLSRRSCQAHLPRPGVTGLRSASGARTRMGRSAASGTFGRESREDPFLRSGRPQTELGYLRRVPAGDEEILQGTDEGPLGIVDGAMRSCVKDRAGMMVCSTRQVWGESCDVRADFVAGHRRRIQPRAGSIRSTHSHSITLWWSRPKSGRNSERVPANPRRVSNPLRRWSMPHRQSVPSERAMAMSFTRCNLSPRQSTICWSMMCFAQQHLIRGERCSPRSCVPGEGE